VVERRNLRDQPGAAGRTSSSARYPPPAAALDWAARSIGPGARVASVRPLTRGRWHANHALVIVVATGESYRVVLRRWARPGWRDEDPHFTAEREIATYELLSSTDLPAPRLLAADPHARSSDVPAILISRLPGHAPGPAESDRADFVEQLVAALLAVHRIGTRARSALDLYRPYYELGAITLAGSFPTPQLWETALELLRAGPPPGPSTFIHRDFHPANTLWLRGRLHGIVDWTAASWGAPGVDLGHLRWNLAAVGRLDRADELLSGYAERAGSVPPGQAYWDVRTLLDLVAGFGRRPPGDHLLARLETYLRGVLSS
jgi:aminoglycoside phosphotransferase (APT) family kinase protein